MRISAAAECDDLNLWMGLQSGYMAGFSKRSSPNNTDTELIDFSLYIGHFL
jgi:hypothetical protein